MSDGLAMLTYSFIVPVKKGGYVAAFDSIRQAGFEKDCYEVLLAEGSAPSHQRNLAASVASGNILYFVDDDSRLGCNNLLLCSSAMDDDQIAVVGGPSITPETDSNLQQMFGFALASAIGAGSVRNRYRVYGQPRETSEKELILCNLAIRRSVFNALGGFNTRLYPNEENEFMDRVRSAGYKLIHIPEMKVFRSQRSSINAFMRQMFYYGRGRARQSLITGSFSIISYVPLLFLLYLLSSVFLVSHKICLVPMALYAVLVLLYTVFGFYETGLLAALMLLVLYPLMHCCNGIGLFCGLVSGKPDPIQDDGIVITRLKEFGQEF